MVSVVPLYELVEVFGPVVVVVAFNGGTPGRRTRQLV